MINKRIKVVALACVLAAWAAGPAADAKANSAVAAGDTALARESDKAWVGIYFETVDRRIADKLGYPHETGVIVSLVIPESPAERGGLKNGDVIYSFDGVAVENADHFQALVKKRRPDDSVAVVIFRKGREKTIDLRLGGQAGRSMHLQELGCSGEDALKSFEKALIAVRGLSAHAYFMRGRTGLLLHDFDDDLAAYFGVRAKDGVLVLDVEEGSPAERSGVKSGDVIVRVNGGLAGSASAAVETIFSVAPGDTLTLDALRKGAKKSFSITVEPTGGSAPFRVLRSGRGALDEDAAEKLRGELDALKKQVQTLKERLKETEEN